MALPLPAPRSAALFKEGWGRRRANAGQDGGKPAALPVTEPVLFSLQRAEDYGPVEVISHWHPNLTINMVDDHTPWVKGSVPPPLDQCKGRDVPELPCSQGGLPGLVLLSPLLGGCVLGSCGERGLVSPSSA